MITQNEVLTEFEINLENSFFFEEVLPWLTSTGLTYKAEHAIDGISLRSVSVPGGRDHTSAEVRQSLRVLLAKKWVPPFIYGDPAKSMSAYLRLSKATDDQRQQMLRYGEPGKIRLYEELDPMCSKKLAQDRQGIEERAVGELPFMAYHFALDGFKVTHMFQAFFADYANAADALSVFALAPGVGAVYVCIDDGTEGAEEAADGEKSG